MELTVDQMLQQGVAAHNAGNPQEAERLYRAILQVQPKHPDANHNLGLIAVSMDQSGVALPLFKNAIDVNPNIEQFWLSYIDALIKEKQFENATQVLEQGKKQGMAGEKLNALEAQLASINQTENVHSASPSQQQLSSLLEHYQNGRYDDAEKSALSLSIQFPRHNFSWKILGAVLKKTGRASEAVFSGKKTVEINPDDAEAYSNLGNTFQELGRLDEADESYTQAIALKPDDAEVHSNLGNTLKALGRLEEAEASCRQAIELKSDLVEAHCNLGNTLQALGRLEESEASLRQAIELKPDFSQAHINMGVTLEELGRLEEAEASYRQAIALKSDFSEAHCNLGNTLQALGRLEEAEASLRQAIALKSDFVEAYSNLGNTLKKLVRLDEAEASYRQAIALKSDFSEAHNNLGNTLKELGRLEEAEASYNLAIALKPDYTSAFMNRCVLLFEKRDFEAALRDSDFCDTKISRQSSLESLYALGRIEEIYQRIEMNSEVDDQNIGIAAFASFLAKIEKKDTANKFCNNPIDFVHFTNISSHLEDSTAFTKEIIAELHDVKKIWEPDTKATRKGFQTPTITNLFANPSVKMASLKSIIIDELAAYYLKFRNDPCSYIQKWPSKINLWGWQVILKHQGHQTPHIHVGGWLSGVIYLKVVPTLEKDEGAIEFSLNGKNYSDVNSPKLTYRPEVGDIVLFPSSLHHRTIPFTTDMDRIIVSFDLMPESAKH